MIRRRFPLILLFLPWVLSAQRGNINLPPGTAMFVPYRTQVCADTIFANNPGCGDLLVVHSSGLCPGTVIIPIELVSFTASRQDGTVLLEWRTASETNSYGFEVQRRAAGTPAWTPLGFIAGTGTSTSTCFYRFMDRQGDPPLPAGINRYRLRMIDLDGSYDFSPEVEVRMDGEQSPFALFPPYPSPASDRLTIPFSLPAEAAVSIALYDVTGMKVRTMVDNRLFVGGSHAILMGTEELADGMYVIEVRFGGERRTAMIGVVRSK